MTKSSLQFKHPELNRRSFLRSLVLSGGLIAGVPILGACSTRSESPGGDASRRAVTGGTFTWGKPFEAISVDPTTSTLGDSWELIHVVYDALVEVDENLEVVPSLATEWTIDNDVEYVFELRRDVKFSNGRPMTAEDVVGTFERYMDPKNGSPLTAFIGTEINVEMVSENSVKFTLPAPNAGFLPALSMATARILPMKEVSEGLDLNMEILGTGPFMVESHRTDQEWILVSNPHAWQKPIVDKLAVQIMPDDAARIAGLRNGSIDYTTFDSPDATQLLKSANDVTTIVQDRTDFYILCLNPKNLEAFRDERVRQAVAHGLNRADLAASALSGVGTPTGAVSAVFPDAPEPTLNEDLELAKELLASAGYADLSFELVYYGGSASVFGRVAQVIQQQLSRIGANVKLTNLEQGVWLSRVFGANPSTVDASIAWYAAYAGPSVAMLNWDPGLAGFAAGFTESDPQVIAALHEAQSAPSNSSAEAIANASKAIDEQANVIPLTTKPVTVAYRQDQVNITTDGTDGNINPLRHAESAVRVSG